MKIKVVAIDDHPLILRAITELITNESDMHLVATASKGSSLHTLVKEKNPDVVILDLGMSNEEFEPIDTQVDPYGWGHVTEIPRVPL